MLSEKVKITGISGPGKVYLQTEDISEFAEWLWAVLEPKVRAVAGAC